MLLKAVTLTGYSGPGAATQPAVHLRVGAPIKPSQRSADTCGMAALWGKLAQQQPEWKENAVFRNHGERFGEMSSQMFKCVSEPNGIQEQPDYIQECLDSICKSNIATSYRSGTKKIYPYFTVGKTLDPSSFDAHLFLVACRHGLFVSVNKQTNRPDKNQYHNARDDVWIIVCQSVSSQTSNLIPVQNRVIGDLLCFQPINSLTLTHSSPVQVFTETSGIIAVSYRGVQEYQQTFHFLSLSRRIPAGITLILLRFFGVEFISIFL
ncbi:hypothetical protein RRG08_041182 [Elysia crispata]|uniref:Uncharacterized protein n=1 Tax=Elysia crispata TaxID=231223 RepID=A0AAE0XY29_9GAST|nr:hypothetical protein RRG08_041182 [Elysia crispata]